MNVYKKRDYHDLRKPYPHPHYASGFGLPRQLPYLRRPNGLLVRFSYELVRLCVCILLVVIAFALVVAMGAHV